MMKMASALSYALSLLVLLMLAFGYSQYAYFTGGPDGYVSDYAAAVRSLYYYFAVPGLLLMGYSLMLGRTARHKPVALRLLAAVLVCAALVLAFAMLDSQYFGALDHGQGG
ncbi:hypothetical protein C4K68_03990 [Pokkaliibacter plantistimulans]|uniref:Uncharacterized protein n=1 Tax=Proteobacteria bacterium 228 TaxID=2083153 RepID=A0A2S5KUZ8_9PROT|nr:hypothetical protein [Pokkaliibacter plantistimulans]PPC78674.1 hypothetical protein C4K68_03990 [Pokkaliibacter plantistimulans]